MKLETSLLNQTSSAPVAGMPWLKRATLGLFLLLAVAFAPMLQAADAVGDYRTRGTGSWNSGGTTVWEKCTVAGSPGTFTATATAPTSNDGVITIRNGHTVNTTSSIGVDQVVVEAGGTISVGSTLTVANGAGTDLDCSGQIINTGGNNTFAIAASATVIMQSGSVYVNRSSSSGTVTPGAGAVFQFANGSTYAHGLAAGNLPTGVTWDDGSTCFITNITSGTSGPNNLGQSFSDLVFSNAAQSATCNLSLGGTGIAVRRDLKFMTTGTGIMRLGTATALTLPVGRTFLIAAGTVQESGTSLSFHTINANNISVTGGTLDLGAATGGTTINVTNSFSVGTGATVSSSSSTRTNFINFVGTNAVINFTNNGTISSAGATGHAWWTVTNGVTLNLSNYVISGTSSKFTNCAGAKIITSHASGLNGNITVSGSTFFDPAGIYEYNGTSAQASGSFLPTTVNKVVMNNAAGVTLTANITVTNLSGSGLVGNTVTLAGSGGVTPGNSPGTLTVTNLTLDAASTNTFELTNSTTAGSGINDLVIVKGALTAAGYIAITNYSASPLDAGDYTLFDYSATGASISGAFNATPVWKSAITNASGLNSSIVDDTVNKKVVLRIAALGTSTTTTITSSSPTSPSTYGDQVTFTATVSPSPLDGGIVTFKDGATTLGTGTLSSGVASYTTTARQLTAGTHANITATFAGDISYALSTSSAYSYTVNTKALTITGVTANNKIYDGGVTATLNVGSAALSGVVSGDTVTLGTGSASGTFATKTVGTGKTVTTSGFTKSGADSANYTLTQPTTSADITAKGVTISGVTANNKTYDATTSATLNTGSATVSGAIGGDDVTVDSSGASGSFATKTVANGKTVTTSGFALTGGDAGNYSLTAQPSTTANITAKNLTITGVTADNKTYDGNTSAIIHTGSAALSGVESGDDVTLDSTSASGSFATKTVANGKTVTTSGFAKTGADAGNYSLTQPSTSADITARTLAVTATGQNKVYNGNDTATVTLDTDKVSGDDVTVGYTGATYDAGKAVGTAKAISVSGISITGGSDQGNYSLGNTTASASADITAKPLTITGVTASDKVYDGGVTATLNTGSAALSGVVGGDDVTLDSTGASGTFGSKTVGTGKTVTTSGFTKTGGDAGNYSLSQPSTTANITPATVTISSGITADNKNYDALTNATISSNSVVLVGVISPDDATLSTNGYVAYFADENPGTGIAVTVTNLTLVGADAGNYSLTQPAGLTADIISSLITIYPEVQVSDKQYDGNNSATITARILHGSIGASDVQLSGGTATFSDAAVGAGKTVTVTGLSLTGADAGNFQLSSTTYVTNASISQKTLTPTVQVDNKVYDGGTSATITNRSLAGIVGSEDVSLGTSGTASFVNKHAGAGKTVNVTGLSLSGADAGNYVLSSTSASTTAEISQLAITVTAVSDTKVYNGTTASAGTPGISPALVGGDTSGFTQTFDNKNVGTGKTLTAAGSANDGNSGANYSVSFVTDATGEITARTLTVSATGQNKAYDGNASATVTLGTDKVSGDDVTVAYTTATFDAGKTVGTAKAISVSGISITGGADAGNYSLGNTTASASANITSVGLTVSGITAANKAYDGGTTATLNVGSATLNGVIGSDDVTLNTGSAVGTFSSAAVGTGKTVTISGLSISGADSGNYSLTQPTTTADIVTGKFRTKSGLTSGNWNGTSPVGASSVWEASADGITYVDASSGPDATTADTIEVRSGNVTVSASVTVDQVTVNSGATVTVASGQTLTVADGTGTDLDVSGTVSNSGTVSGAGSIVFENGGVYDHNEEQGNIPASTWNDGSTCLISGLTGAGATGTPPTGFNNVSFYNLTWNTPNYNNSGSKTMNDSGGVFTQVRGTLNVVNTGTSANGLKLGPQVGKTINVGNLTIGSGAVLNVQSSSGASGNTMTIGGDVSIVGTLLANGGTAITLSFTNTAVVQNFSRSGTITDTGNRLAWNVPANVTLDAGTSVIAGGAFTLNSGATLRIGNTGGIASSGATGNIQTTTRTINSGANLVYNGTAAQSGGTGLTAINNLTINNSAGVTLGAGCTVGGQLTLTSGALTLGANTLTLNGTVSVGSGSLTGGTTSGLSIGGAGANLGIPSIASGLGTLTLNRANGATLSSALTVNTALNLTSGTLTGANNITLGTTTTITTDTGVLDVAPTFGTTVNLTYTGSTARTVNSSSTEVPSGNIGALVVNNTGGVTLSRNLTCTAASTIGAAGKLTVSSGSTLSLAGLSINAGVGTLVTVNGTVATTVAISTGTATTLAFNNGSVYQHNLNGGVAPTATWNSGSTFEYKGGTSSGPTASSMGQTFGNFTWNCAGQSQAIGYAGGFDTATFAGNFTMQNSGGFELRLGSTQTGTIAIGGNLSIMSGASLNLSSGSGVHTLNVSGNVSVASGGTLSVTTAGNGVINFAKSGTQTFTSGGTFTGGINWTVNGTSTTDFGTSVLSGTGTFTVASGATVISAHANGLDGNITVSGTKTLSTTANYTFNGAVAQSAGALLPTTVNNLSVPNTNGVTLVNNLSVSGALSLGYSSGTPTLAVPTTKTLTLNNNATTITIAGASPLTGGSYKLASKAGTGTVTGTPGALTLAGAGAVSGSVTNLAISSGELFLNVIKPTASNVTFSRGKGVSIKIKKSDILANASTQGGETLSLSFDATTANSVTLSSDATYIFVAAETVSDSFNYTVTSSPSGLTASATVTVNVADSTGQTTGSIDTSGGNPSLTFFGIPGYSYTIQVSTDLSNWTDVTTVTAGSTGVITYTDTAPPTPAAFYRTKYNP